MSDLSTLIAEVTNNSTIEGSVLALLKQVMNEILDIPPSNDPVTQALLNKLVATLSQHDMDFAGAVVANTPAAPPAAAVPVAMPPAEEAAA